MTSTVTRIIRWVSTLGLFIACVTLLGAMEQSDLSMPFATTSVTTLPNGLRLVVCENHALPFVAMQVVVRGGSSSEVNSPGVAHYLEHVSFQGTKNYPDPLGPQFALEQAGGISDGETTRDATRYYAEIASDNVDTLVKVLADITMNPLLTNDGCVAEHPVISAEIAQELDEPVIAVLNSAYAFSYPNHPYHDSPESTEAVVSQITPQVIRDFHACWYTPGNISVVLVGDITAQHAKALISSTFGTMSAMPCPAYPDPALASTTGASEVHLTREGLVSTFQVIGFPVPPMRDLSNRVATDLLRAVLSDGPGALLRARWIADKIPFNYYGIECVGSRDAGRLFIWADAPPQMASKLHDSTLALLHDLAKDGIAPSLLEQERRRLATAFEMGNETYAQQADTLAFYEGAGGAEMASQYLPTLAKLPLEQVRLAIPTKPLCWITLEPTVKGIK